LQQQPEYLTNTNPTAPLGKVHTEFETSALLAGFTSANAQILADKIALTYSQIAVGYGAGLFSSRSNDQEQNRFVTLVTRLPLAPFYMLVTLNCLYIIISFFLAVVALQACASSYGAARVKDQLSVWGLVAHGFQVPLVENEVRNGVQVRQELDQQNVGVSVVGVERSREVEWVFCTYNRTTHTSIASGMNINSSDE
jgi:hypothetical protein